MTKPVEEPGKGIRITGWWKPEESFECGWKGMLTHRAWMDGVVAELRRKGIAAEVVTEAGGKIAVVRT